MAKRAAYKKPKEQPLTTLIKPITQFKKGTI